MRVVQSGREEDPNPDLTRPVMGARVGSLWNKGMGVYPWMLLDKSGQAQVVEAGKHEIRRRTGIGARDLRILDPMLFYPSTVLSRERAIVINLENIKAIITAQEILLLNSRDPSVSPFIYELQLRLSRHSQAIRAQKLKAGNGEKESSSKWCDLEEAEAHLTSEQSEESGGVKEENRQGFKVLPFEFIALEACIEAACSSLENRARTIKQETYPALDKLTSKITTLNLERVHNIKSSLVALTGRVGKVRDELEHLLDDDVSMAKMHLTEKLELENPTTFSSFIQRDDTNGVGISADTEYRNLNEISLDATEVSLRPEDYDVRDFDNHRHASLDTPGSHRRGSQRVASMVRKDLDVEELEMLLEAYFVQLDGTLNELSMLKEYIDDTDDYIKLKMDDKQNEVLRMEIMFTTAALLMSTFEVVTGIFGMQIDIELFDRSKAGMREFLWTCGGTAMGSVFFYIIAIRWYKYKRLL